MTNIINTYNTLEKKILERVQCHIEITENIYKDLSSELNITEHELVSTIKKFYTDDVIRNISVILDFKKIGFQSILAALKVDESQVEQVAKHLKSHDGVSHNYLRNNEYNIWFTLILDNKLNIEEEIKLLANSLKAKDYLCLPMQEKIKLNVMLPINNCNNQQLNHSKFQQKNETFIPLSQQEINVLKILQHSLPVISNAWQTLIDKTNINISVKELITIANQLKEKSIIRRFSAVLKQQQSGYVCNALVAWKEKDLDLKLIKNVSDEINSISHVYTRKIVPGQWEYNLYTMVHARTETDLHATIDQFKKRSGLKNYLVLNTIAELKKEPVKYFFDK